MRYIIILKLSGKQKMANIFTEKLASADSEVATLLAEEMERQRSGIELIASENFTSLAVLECLGSIATNKYAEGQVGRRYYGGNEVIDRLEGLAQRRALQAFGLDPAIWGVNVQPYSGSVANAAAYLGLLKPGERLMGLNLPSGGHLTHGYRIPSRPISSSATYYESSPYEIGPDGRIDYDGMLLKAQADRPRLIICGASAYPYDIDYARFRSAADEVGAYLMADIAHIAGFVATGLMANPFEFCDIVTTTTHKTLRGPRAGMIFYRLALKQQIENAVFPGLQGGPHENQIAAIATQMRQVGSADYRAYMALVRANCQALLTALRQKGYQVTDSENHLFLLSLRDKGLTGAQAEKALEAAGISVNKNMIYGDKSALNPSGIRIGTPAITSRGLQPSDMAAIANFIELALLAAADDDADNKLKNIKEQVAEFMKQFAFYN